MTTAAGAVASSRDGRTFRLEPGEGSTFFPGDVVVASTDTGDLVLGQVLTEPSVDDGSALLERLMLTTDLRMVIVDPNADAVRLGETKPGTPDADAARIGQRGVRVLRSDANRSGDALPLRLRSRTTARQAQAAVLQLDPVRDEDLYNAFVRSMPTRARPATSGSCSSACRRAMPRTGACCSASRTSG